MKKPNINDISDMNVLGIRTNFILLFHVGKLQLYIKSYSDEGDCFRDVPVEFIFCHSTRYCNGVRSIINQAHKHPKQSIAYGRENSIAQLHFIVINQHMVLQRNAGFKRQALKSPKMNITDILSKNVAISISN